MKLPRPTHGTVAAYLALFIALGGTSYAATQLAANSVGTTQLKSNAVTGSKVKNGSLSAGDFKASSLPAGPKGDTGATGATGAPGPAGSGSGAAIVASLNADGTVVAGQTTGLTSANVLRQFAGVYCISGLSFTPRNVQITTGNGFNGAAVGNATIGAFGQCAVGTQISIVMRQAVTGNVIDNAFFLTVN